MGEWVIGVDLGATKIDVGLVSPRNEIVGRRRVPTLASEGPERVVERIAGCVEDLAELLPTARRIAALGICCPGPVDHESGTLVEPPNLTELHNVPLGPALSARLGIPVRLEHDAKTAALGEYHFGAGRGERSMVFVVVGTGVGGAIIVDGELFRGPENSAGEIGHVTLDRGGELCSCGNRGCVETFVAGPWLARRYARYAAARGAGAPEEVTGERVVSLAARDDPLARRVMDEAGEALGSAVATMAMLLNVDLFVIGGSVAKAGDLLLEPARRALLDHCYRTVGCDVRLVPTELADDGPILGCAWLARQALGALAAEPTARSASLAPAERAALEAVEGFVFDVQRFSLHDGAGIRTCVFLKGCPLRCLWCDNPESQRPRPDLMLSEQRCVSCGLHPEPCPAAWHEDGQTPSGRARYSERAAVCPTRALRWSGERRAAGEILAEVLRDEPFYDGGGMTLSGGEPTYQPRLAEALLRLAKARGLATALETCGYTRAKTLERLLPFLDEVLFDLKHVDAEIHRAATGVDNVLILANLRRLATLRAPVKVRVPLIPGFNADARTVDGIARLVAGLDGLDRSICLLPYHALGQAKYRALNRPYPWEGHGRLDDGEVQALREVAEARGLTVTVGG